jgi:hypothetical protein
VRTEILIVHPTDDDSPVDMSTERIPLGSQSEVRAALQETFGEGTWQAPDEGVFDGDGFSLLARVGPFPDVESMTLEVWGAGDPIPYIRTLCLPREWHAFDLESGETITELNVS